MSSTGRIELDALSVGEMGRFYTVATYASKEHGRLMVNTYTRDYNPAWEGCVMYEVAAPSAAKAKAAAKRHRTAMEREK